jgi:hypothetical protein
MNRSSEKPAEFREDGTIVAAKYAVSAAAQRPFGGSLCDLAPVARGTGDRLHLMFPILGRCQRRGCAHPDPR